MPLLDHFRSPTFEAAPWTSIGTYWMVNVAKYLNRTLPDAGYRAFVRVHSGNKVDSDESEFSVVEGGSVPPPLATIRPILPQQYAVEVARSNGEPVAFIELVTPRMADGANTYRQIVGRCFSHLWMGIGVVLIDTITYRHRNVSNELVASLGANGPMLTDCPTYVSSFRPTPRDASPRVDVWPYAAPVGQRIPSVPLPLAAGPPLMIDLESTYTEACTDHGL